MKIHSPGKGLREQVSSCAVFASFLLSLVALLILIGCGGLGTDSSLQTTRSSSSLALSPANLDFGVVATNSQRAQRLVKIVNQGERTMQIQSANVPTNSAFVLSNWSGPVLLSPGQTLQLQMVFAPRNAGTYAGELTVHAIEAPRPVLSRVNSDSHRYFPPRIGESVILPLAGKATPVSSNSGGSGGNNGGQGTGSGGQGNNGGGQGNNSGGQGNNGGGSSGGGSGSGGGQSNPPAILTIEVPSATVHAAYSTLLAASGGQPPYQWSVGGSLPAGIHLNASTGLLNGTPSTTGSFSFTIMLSDASNETATQGLTLIVAAATQNTWTALNQQPVTEVFFPNSLWTTPLPTSGNHAVQSNFLTNSDAIVKNLYANSDFTGTTVNCLSTTPTGNTCSNQKAFYYASQADPVFCITSVNNHTRQSTNNPTGKCFHFPAGAPFASYTTDQTILIWDQSSDIDPIPGGRIFAVYGFCSGGSNACPLTIPASCSAKTSSQAMQQSACQLSFNWADYDYPFNDALGGIQDGVAWLNDNAGSGSSLTRDKEIIAQSIPHALAVNAICVAPGPSFPSSGDGNSCAALSNSSGMPVPNPSAAPHVGSLFWVDQAYDCTTRGLLPPQIAFCQAMQTYGAYMTATGGNYFGQWNGLFMNGLEGPVAEHFAGASDPVDILDYLNAYSGDSPSSPIYCTGSPVTRCNFAAFQGWPGLIEGDSANGFMPHLHIIDPCVPKSVVGISASCTGSSND